MKIILIRGRKSIKERFFSFRHFFLVYFIYIIFSSVFYFALPHRPSTDDYTQEFPKSLLELETNLDRVVLVDDGQESIAMRLALIEAAEDTIELAYHSLHTGLIADVVFATLLEAADRGVQVRIIMDGIFHRLYGGARDLRLVLESHPNIEFRLYEPLSWYKPHTWNNRLHDKIMIVDKEVGLISGRNIGNRYYLSEELTQEFVLDMDVVVLSKAGMDPSSAVRQLKDYFNLLWEHPYTEEIKVRSIFKQQEKIDKYRQVLRDSLKQAKETAHHEIQDVYTWLAERSLEANRILLIHNPIMRGKKEPWVWASLAKLAQEAEKSIVVQSPYIIPTKSMMGYFDEGSIAGKEVLLLTNSLASSPNLLAVSGYKGKRERLSQWVTEIWEYYGPGSLHGKAMLFDDELSVVGSFNVDARSSFLSTETMLVIESEDFNTHLRNVMEAKTEYSQAILASQGSPPAPWPKRLLVRFIQFFTKHLDYLL